MTGLIINRLRSNGIGSEVSRYYMISVPNLQSIKVSTDDRMVHIWIPGLIDPLNILHSDFTLITKIPTLFNVENTKCIFSSH